MLCCIFTGAKLAPALKISKPEDSSAEAEAAPAADEDEQQRSKKKKKVHFQMDKPWVPPHRRSSDWGDRPRWVSRKSLANSSCALQRQCTAS